MFLSISLYLPCAYVIFCNTQKVLVRCVIQVVLFSEIKETLEGREYDISRYTFIYGIPFVTVLDRIIGKRIA